MSDDFQDLVPDIERMADLTPQMAAVLPAQIQTMKNQKQMMLNQYQAQKAQQDQNIAQQENATAMGQAFDAARNDDTFYLPPEAFGTADFQRGMKLFISPDGHAVRFTVNHQATRSASRVRRTSSRCAPPLSTPSRARRWRVRRYTSAAAHR